MITEANNLITNTINGSETLKGVFSFFVQTNLITLGTNLLFAAILIFGGFKIIHVLEKLLFKSLEKRKVDKSIKHFAMSCLKIGAKTLLLVSAADIVGIQTTSFVAIMGAAGFAIGLALQGTLSNFAGGVLLLVLKPCKVGEFIEVDGYTGFVSAIEIFYTTITTPENKLCIIPNSVVSSSSLTNYSRLKTRRIDLTFGVSYDSDIKKVKQILTKVANSHSKVLKTPEPFIAVAELGDSSVNFLVRVWANFDHYWDVHFDLIEEVKIALDEASIEIPYPHMDVNLKGNVK